MSTCCHPAITSLNGTSSSKRTMSRTLALQPGGITECGCCQRRIHGYCVRSLQGLQRRSATAQQEENEGCTETRSSQQYGRRSQLHPAFVTCRLVMMVLVLVSKHWSLMIEALAPISIRTIRQFSPPASLPSSLFHNNHPRATYPFPASCSYPWHQPCRDYRHSYSHSSSSSSLHWPLRAGLSLKSAADTSSNSSIHSAEESSSSLSSAVQHQQQQQQQPLEPVPPFRVTLEGDDYSYKDAIIRTLGWVGAAITFGGCIWSFAGSAAGEEFFAGYLVEESLSVDNLFVFLLLFEFFKVPVQYQDRVLNWGIYGAIVMRGIMIGLGSAALQNFHEILLVFAAILIYSSAKFFVKALRDANDSHRTDEDGVMDSDENDPSQNSIVRFSRSLIPATDHFDGDRFFTVLDGIRMATPLFICMISVEISDVVFAVDSIPAVFGVTENPLIVFSSNLFAIMGLRSLYTILSKAATDLKYLEPAVALVLGFIGCKMVAEYFGILIPTSIALMVVASLLGLGIGTSVLEKERQLDEQNEAPTSFK